ncbi:MAG: hypothetical protein M9945_14155 [Aquamicrobium sp.]|uniref:hypothetical protein n=1 Tax=Aquamicrobium sp. TaxID=1872579 RepID=UPI00349E59BD|nr:hypothetical protein [Aquamicrobium sp.]
MKATELQGTDVNFVSLVKRGANRIPFRITKGDEPMLDLHKIGRTLFKKAEAKPEIVAAIMQPGTDADALARTFKEAGLNPAEYTPVEKDGVIVVAKANAEAAEDTVIIKANDNIAFVISNMKKAFSDYDYESKDFLTVLKTNGFYPTLCAAHEAFATTVTNILYDANSPTEAAQSISKAADDFKSYVTAMASSLPVQAFKMEVALTKADAGKNGTGAGFEAGKGTGTSPRATADDAANTAVNATGGESTTGNPDEAPVDAQKGDGKPPMAAKDKDKEKETEEARKAELKNLPQPTGHEPGDADGFAAPPADTQRAVAHASADDKKMKLNGGTTGSSIPDGNSGLARFGGVRKNEGDDQIGGEQQTLPEHQSGAGAQQPNPEKPTAADLTKSENDAILQAIANLQKSVSEQVSGLENALQKQVGYLNTRVDQVATMARKTDAALNGTVFAESPADRAAARKGEVENVDIPLLDTGLSRRSAA